MYLTLRLLSLALIVTGLVLLGADAITTLDKGGEITVRSIEQVWASLVPGGADGFKAWMEHAFPPGMAQGIETVLGLPGWAVTGVLGVILNFLPGRTAAAAA
jgi:hypothetical protein